jgi:hypothetical protein
MKTVLTPICGFVENDANTLAPYFSSFEMPAAERFDVCAIALRYKVGYRATLDGGASLLTRSPEGTVSLVSKPNGDRGPDGVDEYTSLARHVHGIRLADVLLSDLSEVSNTKAWLFIFPGLLLMQSDNPKRDVTTIEGIYDDMTDSHWARSACGRLRFPYPQSNHQRLKLLESISDAMDVVKNLRSTAMSDLSDAGYEVGPVTYNSLSEDIDG